MKSVRIVSPDGIANSTKITNSDGGDEILGVTRISIDLAAGDMCRAKLEIVGIQTDVRADAEFLIVHPKTGKLQPVKWIEFADGESVDF